MFRPSKRHVPLSSVSVVGGGKGDSEVNLRMLRTLRNKDIVHGSGVGDFW